MSMRFDKMAEQQIKKAQAEGQFDNLKGVGKPLKEQAGPSSTLTSGFGIMAEAGVVPREIELRKLIDAQREALNNSEEGDRKDIMKTLADLQLRLSIEEDARRKYMRTSK